MRTQDYVQLRDKQYDGDDDVLGCFGMEMDDLEELELEDVYAIVRKKHLDHMREWSAF